MAQTSRSTSRATATRNKAPASTKTTATPTREALQDVTAGGNVDGDVLDRLARMEALVKKAEDEKTALQQQLAAAQAQAPPLASQVARVTATEKIPRPKRGTSIQEGMGLANNSLKYHSLQRNIQDITLESGIKWEVPWAEIAPRDKAKLYQAVCEQMVAMKAYENDWATEALVRQFIKNRRSNCYKKGYLEVPTKYAYLKENAAKRSDAPRGNGRPRAVVTRIDPAAHDPPTASGSKRSIPPTAPAASSSKKRKVARPKAPAPGKGKGRQRTPLLNSEEENEGLEEDGEEEEE